MAKNKATEAPAKEKSKALAPTASRQLVKRSGTKIAGKGFENLEREDILLPRLTLLQPLSPEVVDKGEKPGTLYLNLSNKSLGAVITITPVLHYRSRIKWTPKDDGGGIDCSSQDAKTPRDTKYAQSCSECSHKEWNNDAKKKEDQAPKCTMYENFVVLVGDETEPVILPMGITKAKVAKKFYSMAAVKGGNMFDNQYKLGVVQEKNDKGQAYFNFVVSDIGKRTDEKRRAVADRLWEALQKANITTEMEHPETEVSQAGEPVTAAGGKF